MALPNRICCFRSDRLERSGPRTYLCHFRGYSLLDTATGTLHTFVHTDYGWIH
jgi:hypothetical protein